MATSMSKRALEVLNKQIIEEFQSALVYLSMSGVFAGMGLNGCMQWARLQSQNSNTSALKIFDYIVERGMKVKLAQMQAPRQDWRAPLHVFEEILRFEQKATAAIYAILDICVADQDHATSIFIQPFIQQQVKKEATATFLLDRLRKMQSTELGVIMFDEHLDKKLSAEDCSNNGIFSTFG